MCNSQCNDSKDWNDFEEMEEKARDDRNEGSGMKIWGEADRDDRKSGGLAKMEGERNKGEITEDTGT